MKSSYFICLVLTLMTPSILLAQDKSAENPPKELTPVKQEPHKYGGWYCPDNLYGFPAVDISNWETVPVVNGRMPTREEANSGASLIYVDKDKYPNARPLDMHMPRLARFNCHPSGKNEIVIVIQAIQVQEDSVVGFRYLNGGNGSARLNEVDFLTEDEIRNLPYSQFVTIKLSIDAPQEEIFDVMTDLEYCKSLEPIFDPKNKLQEGWENVSKVNFKYQKAGTVTSQFAGTHFGAKYIQIDCQNKDYQYVEKMLIMQNEDGKSSDVVITCGPYLDDFESQEAILNAWAMKVKEMSETN